MPVATLTSVATNIDYVAHLTAESARFGAAIRNVPPAAAVPTCPDWNADDLLWHLAWVQSWWGIVVRDNVDGPQARASLPARPDDRAGLLALFEQASRELAGVLAAATPQTPAWTWSTDHTVGFIRRKQAHEALIHRVDAELVAGRRTPMDPALSADGVDEALRIMYGGLPDWGSFTRSPAGPCGSAPRTPATPGTSSWSASPAPVRTESPTTSLISVPASTTTASRPRPPSAAPPRTWTVGSGTGPRSGSSSGRVKPRRSITSSRPSRTPSTDPALSWACRRGTRPVPGPGGRGAGPGDRTAWWPATGPGRADPGPDPGYGRAGPAG